MNQLHSSREAVQRPASTDTGNGGPRAVDEKHPAPRLDLYRLAHKGLRAFLCEVLGRCGRIDPANPADTLSLVRDSIALCRIHLRHEEQVIHAAMNSRSTGSARTTERDHVRHLESFDRLERAVQQVEASQPANRPAATHHLYLEFALFVADNLVHMHIEETENNEMLWENFTDAELLELQRRIVDAIPAAQMALFLRWMVPSMTPGEREGFLAAMARSAPPEVNEQTLSMLAPHLEQGRFVDPSAQPAA